MSYPCKVLCITPAVEPPFLGAATAIYCMVTCQKPSEAQPPAAGSARTLLIGGARATPERARRADAQQPAIGRMAEGQVSDSERSVLSLTNMENPARYIIRASFSMG